MGILVTSDYRGSLKTYFPFSGCLYKTNNRWSVGDSPTSWQTSHALFSQPFGGEPPFHFRFQAAYSFSINTIPFKSTSIKNILILHIIPLI